MIGKTDKTPPLNICQVPLLQFNNMEHELPVPELSGLAEPDLTPGNHYTGPIPTYFKCRQQSIEREFHAKCLRNATTCAECGWSKTFR